jgi:DNA-binding XRE family transcriptional regulator
MSRHLGTSCNNLWYSTRKEAQTVMAFSEQQPPEEEPMVPAPTSTTPLPYLRHWRLHRLMTVRGLGAAAGVGFTTVARIESGYPAAAITAIKLARALGVTVRQLKEEQPED